jgi:hypothetical protein
VEETDVRAVLAAWEGDFGGFRVDGFAGGGEGGSGGDDGEDAAAVGFEVAFVVETSAAVERGGVGDGVEAGDGVAGATGFRVAVAGEDEAETPVEGEIGTYKGINVYVDAVEEASKAESDFNKESRLIDLELSLAEAVHYVQDIEDQIADLEKEDLID